MRRGGGQKMSQKKPSKPHKGPFNNYVDKTRGGGGQKMSVFVHAGGGGGQEMAKFCPGSC